MRLHDLKPNPGAKHRKKRLGSGESSGLGKTCGKGHKGQKSRSGASIRPSFEGGQMPIYRRLPKKGFSNVRFRKNFAVVNVSDLETFFDDGDTVNEETLRAAGLVQGKAWDGVKVLGTGDVSKKLTVEVDRISGAAKDKLEKAGGSVTVASAEVAPKKKKKAAPAKEKAAPAEEEKAAPAEEEKAAPAEEEEAAPAEEETPAAEEKAPADDAEPEAEAEEAAGEEE